jgi:hypothetical protein
LDFYHSRDSTSASSKASLVSLTSDVRHLEEFSELIHRVSTTLSEQEERIESYDLQGVPVPDTSDEVSDIFDTWKDSPTVPFQEDWEEELEGLDITTVSPSLPPPVPPAATYTEQAVGQAELRIERRLFVEKLLLDKFDYDEFGNRTSSEKYDSLLQSTSRILAPGIYCNDAVHFIYELLQNADDNEYGEGVTPSVIIEINQTEMRFHTNERGWKEEHITAVCALCGSSKEVRRTVV